MLYFIVTNEGVSIILVTSDQKLILNSSFIYSLQSDISFWRCLHTMRSIILSSASSAACLSGLPTMSVMQLLSCLIALTMAVSFTFCSSGVVSQPLNHFSLNSYLITSSSSLSLICQTKVHNCKCSYLLLYFIVLLSKILLLIEFCFIISLIFLFSPLALNIRPSV